MTRLIGGAKNRAKTKNLPFDITAHDLLDLYHEQEGCCAISGIPFDLTKSDVDGTPRFNTVSLDRIVPHKGYIKGNVRLVCYQVNCAISEFGAEHFIELCKIITERTGTV
jgi:hypothetical protein